MQQSKKLEYRPEFKLRFLLPSYWLIWLGIFTLWLLSFSSNSFKRFLAKKITSLSAKQGSKRYHIAEVNLKLCFPEKSEQQIAEFLQLFFYYKSRIYLDYAFLWFASEKKLNKAYRIKNENELKKLKAADENIIFLTCHMLALDHGAQALSFDYPIVGLIKPMKNPLMDWLVARGRTRFNTRLYERRFGMKGVVSSVKKGDQFFYLPDEDLGNEKSEFLDFFGVQKATITALGRLAKVCNAKVLPCVPVFDDETGVYDVEFLGVLEEFPSADKIADAVVMNQVLEKMILLAPEQYMWTFRYFQTRPEGESPVY